MRASGGSLRAGAGLATIHSVAVTESEPIEIVAYNPEWPAQFEEERSALADAIGDFATGGIHHVGSTAVPGLDAPNRPRYVNYPGLKSRACTTGITGCDAAFTSSPTPGCPGWGGGR